ncbi:MAG TPA: hypothetical protein VN605_06915, partial [Thermoanaerobaculia bacterium]|nr:hypothetical protein [Thermoanaerobaculia bacterium]
SVSAASVREFVAQHLGGNDATIVIVGDAKKFLEPLQKRFGEVQVIPIGRLDLNVASLQR